MAHDHKCASCDRWIISPHAQCPYCLLHRPMPAAVVPPAPVVPHQPAPVHLPGPPQVHPVAGPQAVPVPPMGHAVAPAHAPVLAPVAMAAPVPAPAPLFQARPRLGCGDVRELAMDARAEQRRAGLDALAGVLGHVLAALVPVGQLRFPPLQAPAAADAAPHLPAVAPLLRAAGHAHADALLAKALMENNQVLLRGMNAALVPMAQIVPAYCQMAAILPPLPPPLVAADHDLPPVAARVVQANRLVFEMLNAATDLVRQGDLSFLHAQLLGLVGLIQADVAQIRAAAAWPV